MMVFYQLNKFFKMNEEHGLLLLHESLFLVVPITVHSYVIALPLSLCQ